MEVSFVAITWAGVLIFYLQWSTALLIWILYASIKIVSTGFNFSNSSLSAEQVQHTEIMGRCIGNQKNVEQTFSLEVGIIKFEVNYDGYLKLDLKSLKLFEMNMQNFIIRKVTSNDINQLQEIGEKTFRETFEASNSEEDMKEYLFKNFSKSKINAELSEPNSEFYFALLNEKIVGYLKINWGASQTENPDKNALEIERIYVSKEFHGKKLGQVLYEKALEISVQKNVEYIWLGVWEENPRAIRFYKKNGFEEFGKHIFQLGDDKQTDIMMKRPINSSE